MSRAGVPNIVEPHPVSTTLIQPSHFPSAPLGGGGGSLDVPCGASRGRGLDCQGAGLVVVAAVERDWVIS